MAHNSSKLPSLPIHLSHKSALVLLPPNAIQPPIEALRHEHDRHFNRWPPHINLIYPFLAHPSVTDPAQNKPNGSIKTLRPRIRQRIESAVRKSDTRSFRITLSASPTGMFQHGRKSATIWLRPVDAPQGESTAGKEAASVPPKTLLELQSALQAEFRECNADTRPFTPHLSIGQAQGARPAAELAAEAKAAVESFVAGRNGGAGRGGIAAGGAAPELEWTVDRVFVIERDGFHGRFEVIGEVLLGQPVSVEPDSELEAERDGFVYLREEDCRPESGSE